MSKENWKHLKEYKSSVINGNAIMLVWQIQDVISKAAEIGTPVSNPEAREILESLKYSHEHGLTWDTIESAIVDKVNSRPKPMTERSLTVKISIPENVSDNDAQAYVLEAVKSHGGAYRKDDQFFPSNWKSDEVKVIVDEKSEISSAVETDKKNDPLHKLYVCESSGANEKCKSCDHSKPHKHKASCDGGYCGTISRSVSCRESLCQITQS